MNTIISSNFKAFKLLIVVFTVMFTQIMSVSAQCDPTVTNNAVLLYVNDQPLTSSLTDGSWLESYYDYQFNFYQGGVQVASHEMERDAEGNLILLK